MSENKKRDVIIAVAVLTVLSATVAASATFDIKTFHTEQSEPETEEIEVKHNGSFDDEFSALTKNGISVKAHVSTEYKLDPEAGDWSKVGTNEEIERRGIRPLVRQAVKYKMTMKTVSDLADGDRDFYVRHLEEYEDRYGVRIKYEVREITFPDDIAEEIERKEKWKQRVN